MIYGYARVSTTGQASNGNSLDDQKDKILSVYPDAMVMEEAYTGTKMDRPVFSTMITKMTEGDTLVVTKLDRFCRSAKEGLEYIDQLIALGVKVHILNMGLVDNTPMGRVMVTMLLAFAEFERSQIIERTQAGKAVARQREDYKEGRPKKSVPIDILNAYLTGDITGETAAKMAGVSRRTLCEAAKASRAA